MFEESQMGLDQVRFGTPRPIYSRQFKLLNSIENIKGSWLFGGNDVPSYLPIIFSDQGFFPWKSLSALEDFMPVYRSHHPKVMVMRDQLGVSLWGRLHCTLSTSLYCNCTTWSYANQSCIPRCKLNSKEIKYYTYNAYLPDQSSCLLNSVGISLNSKVCSLINSIDVQCAHWLRRRLVQKM